MQITKYEGSTGKQKSLISAIPTQFQQQCKSYLPWIVSHCPSFEMAKPSGFMDGIKCILVLSNSHFMYESESYEVTRCCNTSYKFLYLIEQNTLKYCISTHYLVLNFTCKKKQQKLIALLNFVVQNCKILLQSCCVLRI